MKCFKSNKDVVKNQAIFCKARLMFCYKFWQDFFQPICKYLGENFVQDITQANKAVLMNIFRVCDFLNESNESVVDRV